MERTPTEECEGERSVRKGEQPEIRHGNESTEKI